MPADLIPHHRFPKDPLINQAPGIMDYGDNHTRRLALSKIARLRKNHGSDNRVHRLPRRFLARFRSFPEENRAPVDHVALAQGIGGLRVTVHVERSFIHGEEWIGKSNRTTPDLYRLRFTRAGKVARDGNILVRERGERIRQPNDAGCAGSPASDLLSVVNNRTVWVRLTQVIEQGCSEMVGRETVLDLEHVQKASKCRSRPPTRWRGSLRGCGGVRLVRVSEPQGKNPADLLHLFRCRDAQLRISPVA